MRPRARASGRWSARSPRKPERARPGPSGGRVRSPGARSSSLSWSPRRLPSYWKRRSTPPCTKIPSATAAGLSRRPFACSSLPSSSREPRCRRPPSAPCRGRGNARSLAETATLVARRVFSNSITSSRRPAVAPTIQPISAGSAEATTATKQSEYSARSESFGPGASAKSRARSGDWASARARRRARRAQRFSAQPTWRWLRSSAKHSSSCIPRSRSVPTAEAARVPDSSHARNARPQRSRRSTIERWAWRSTAVAQMLVEDEPWSAVKFWVEPRVPRSNDQPLPS